jgi:hypothetical protein
MHHPMENLLPSLQMRLDPPLIYGNHELSKPHDSTYSVSTFVRNKIIHFFFNSSLTDVRQACFNEADKSKNGMENSEIFKTMKRQWNILITGSRLDGIA